jgi:hypothetical protein
MHSKIFSSDIENEFLIKKFDEVSNGIVFYFKSGLKRSL